MTDKESSVRGEMGLFSVKDSAVFEVKGGGMGNKGGAGTTQPGISGVSPPPMTNANARLLHKFFPFIQKHEEQNV